MRIGLCCGVERAEEALSAGFDYIETAGHPLAAGERYPGLPVEACNQFFPWGARIWRDVEAARDHAMRMIEGAAEAGIEILVVGSGMAREAPEGENPKDYELRFADFCGWMADMAGRSDILIAPEPLNRKECQVGWDYASLSTSLAARGCPHCADSYHIILEAPEGSPWEDLIPLKPVHVHLSDRDRTLGSENDPELLAFLRRLRSLGYTGRMSFEGHWDQHLEVLVQRIQRLVSQA